jgi:ferritin
MIISPKVVDAINDQIRNEFTASAQYVAIAVYFDEEGLPDLAQFFYNQAEEERFHAMKFVKFLLDTGAKPIIPDQPSLRNEFGGAADAVSFALEQEGTVTNQINNIVSLAIAENDHASNQFLQWFVDEQVEEIDSMTTLLQTIKHAGPYLLLVEDFVRRKMAAEAGGEA